MQKLVAGLAVAGAAFMSWVACAQPDKPTIVLVHGAFAGASSWNGVATMLEKSMHQPGRVVSETCVDAAKGPPVTSCSP